jgi:branched-chain amino acid transport system ATP-binding protein
MSVLQAKNLSGGYRSLVIFSKLELAVDEKAIIGIVGPNGVGKSTLLKTLAGLLPVHAGTITFRNEDVTALSAHPRARKGLVLIPEGRQIFQHLTVQENLGIGKPASRLSAAEYARQFDGLLSIFPRLKERLRQKGGSLSGGEQQMLAIGRGLLLGPDVLMLDEPTQGLAPIMVSQVLSALQELRGRFSMLIVEQNREFLAKLCDITLSFGHGTLQP